MKQITSMNRPFIFYFLFFIYCFLFLLLPACKKPHPGARPDASIKRSAGKQNAKYQHCARVDPGAAGKVKPITMAGVELSLVGPVLSGGGQHRPGRLVLGVLGDTREALPATLKKLGLLVGEFRRAKAAAVVLLGGIDKSYEGVRAVLARLREGGLPVLALPGDRASRAGFSGAVENLGGGVVDFTRVKAVVHPRATLVGLPGYFRAHHLLAGEQGCSYDAPDLRLLGALAARLPAPRVLLSHGPMRGSKPGDVDRAFGDINVGDPLITRLVVDGKFAVVLSAHVHESAGRARTLGGEPVAEGAWTPTLQLNVGAADTTPHEDLAGGWSSGTAALVELEPARARFRMIKLKLLTASKAAASGASRQRGRPKPL